MGVRSMLDLSAQATITKHHRLSGLNNSNLLSHGSGGWKYKIYVSTGLVSGVTSLFGLQMAAFWLCPHMAFSLCVHKKTKHELWGPSSYKDQSY